MDWGLLLLALFLGSYIPATNSYMPPPADDILGYYYYDNGDLFRVREKTNIIENSRKRRNNFPFIFGKTKVTIYTGQEQSETILYKYTFVCVGPYLCTNTQRETFHSKGIVTEVRLEHLSIISSVNRMDFIFLGISDENVEEKALKKY